MSDGFFSRRLVRPLLDLLRQGVTPEKVALSLALGVVLGVFPVLGSTTTLCALAALALQLNLPAIQIVNYFVYPLQIALLIPFFRLGERLFGSPPYAAFGSADLCDDSRQYGRGYRRAVDHHVARNGRMVPGRPSLRGRTVRDSRAGAAPSRAPQNPTRC